MITLLGTCGYEVSHLVRIDDISRSVSQFSKLVNGVNPLNSQYNYLGPWKIESGTFPEFSNGSLWFRIRPNGSVWTFHVSTYEQAELRPPKLTDGGDAQGTSIRRCIQLARQYVEVLAPPYRLSTSDLREKVTIDITEDNLTSLDFAYYKDIPIWDANITVGVDRYYGTLVNFGVNHPWRMDGPPVFHNESPGVDRMGIRYRAYKLIQSKTSIHAKKIAVPWLYWYAGNPKSPKHELYEAHLRYGVWTLENSEEMWCWFGAVSGDLIDVRNNRKGYLTKEPKPNPAIEDKFKWSQTPVTVQLTGPKKSIEVNEAFLTPIDAESPDQVGKPLVMFQDLLGADVYFDAASGLVSHKMPDGKLSFAKPSANLLAALKQFDFAQFEQVQKTKSR